MTVAVILAGGVGVRMKHVVPKQFIKVLGKPVIVHTLEVFEASGEIDAIQVVTVPDYANEVRGYGAKYGLSKLQWVVDGGVTCQESIRNGVMALKNVCLHDDVVMLAMSVCPLITPDIIKDSIGVCKKYGGAIAAAHSIYNLSTIQDGHWADNYILKEEHVTLNLPWTFPFRKLLWAYEKAYADNVGTDVRSYTPTLMVDLGEKLYFSKDSQANKLKLTTFDDLDMLEGYLLLNELRRGNLDAVTDIRKTKEEM